MGERGEGIIGAECQAKKTQPKVRAENYVVASQGRLASEWTRWDRSEQCTRNPLIHTQRRLRQSLVPLPGIAKPELLFAHRNGAVSSASHIG